MRTALVVRALRVAVVVPFFTSSCATNPATGRSQLNFYSEAEEIELGRKSDAEIVAQLGLLDEPRLAARVTALGRELSAKSERPGLPWSFRVVDDPVVNAFALPGGYIYVTRGILGHLSSDAELAAVLGHEIGHVTAQHSVNQLSKAQLAQGGLLVGAIVAPGAAQAVGGLAEAGVGALFLKFGRDDERQADDLGLRSLTQAGYDPHEMPKLFDVLRRVSADAEGSRLPGWLQTHPDPEQRRERARRLIAERNYPAGEVGAAEYVERLDGLAFGADPRQGYFEGSRFYHPKLGFRFDLPAGWAAVNQTDAVVAVHPRKDAQIALALAGEKSAQAAATAFAGQDGLEVEGPNPAALDGMPSYETTFRLARQGGEALVGRATFVEHGGVVFRLLGVALEGKSAERGRELAASLRSFARLTDAAKLQVEPQRLRVVVLPAAMSFERFLRDYPSEAKAEEVALVNGIDDPQATLEAGTRMKRIVGRRVGEQRIGPELDGG